MCGYTTVEKNTSYTEANLKLYYKHVQRTPVNLTELEPLDPRVINAKKRVDFLINNSKGKKLLEIGYGDGITLLECNKAGYDVTGIDLSEGYLENNDLFLNQNITIVNSDFNSLQDHYQFDVICFFLLFEHILNPVEFLSKVKSHLIKGGFIVLEVPNIANYKDFYSETMMTHEHITHFDPTLIDKLLVDNGFVKNVIYEKGTSYGFSMTVAYQLLEKPQRTEVKKNYGLIVTEEFNKYFSNLDTYKTLLKEKVSNIINNEQKIYVFGAGNFLNFIAELFDDNQFKKSIEVIFDETKSKVGEYMLETPIRHVNDIVNMKPLTVIIASEMFGKEISTRIKALNEDCNPVFLNWEVITNLNSEK